MISLNPSVTSPHQLSNHRIVAIKASVQHVSMKTKIDQLSFTDLQDNICLSSF